MSLYEPTRRRKKKRQRYTAIHQKVLSFLIKEGYTCKAEYRIGGGRDYRFDIYVKESHTLVEVNGDYWHGNPRIYEATDQGITNEPYKVIWKRDAAKAKYARKKGYNVIILWESDINEDWENTSSKLLNYLLG